MPDPAVLVGRIAQDRTCRVALMPNDGIRRGMERPGRRSEGRQWNWRPERRPPEADGRRLHTEVGPYLAMDGARLNFLTNIHVRASHYRLSAGSATRDRPPPREHDLSMRSACGSRVQCTRPTCAPLACALPYSQQRETDALLLHERLMLDISAPLPSLSDGFWS